MPKVAKVLPHGLSVAYYVVDDKYVYGPFGDSSVARDWTETHTIFGDPKYISMGPLQRIGTMDVADSVGIVMVLM